jgi:Antitoxin Xre/MbcA/ParS C-terminal toxin-binding domain
MAAALVLPNVAGYAFDVSPNLSDAATRERLSLSAIKGFLRIMEKWEIKDPDARQLLGGLSSGSYYGLKKEPKHRTLDQDTLTRISLLVGIFKALNILYSPALADAWMTLPNRNPMFRGMSPLAYMIQRGQPGMLHVRQLLDARRGGQ